MATTPMSTSGNIEELLGRTTDTILENIRNIYDPLVQSSYWAQRCSENIKHGVFYCVSFLNKNVHLTPYPFWSSMPEGEQLEVERRLTELDLKIHLLLCVLHAPFQIGSQDLSFSTSVMLLTETKVYAGLFHSPDQDVYFTSDDLPDGMKILSQDLASFFAHL